MLSIDLFDSKYERRLHEGAVDDLEQHRIDVLNDRMQELLARARTAAPDQKASLKQQYEKIKSERDSYYRVREDSHMYQGPHGRQDVERKNGVTRVSRRDWDDSVNATTYTPGGKYFPNKDLRGQGTGSGVKSGSGVSSTQGSMRKYPRLDHDGNNTPNYEVDETGIPGNIPKEKIPGKEELLKGRGRTYYEGEGQKKNSRSPLNQRLDRLKVQARREFPQVDSDVEALLLKLLDKEAHDDRQNRQTDARQDAELKRNFSLDREQEDEIADLQTQVGVREHGGGIGPRQHWQDLMQEEELIEGIRDTTAATAVITCLLTGGSLTGCATAPQKTTAQQVLKTGQDVGRTVQTAKKITRAGAEAEVNQEIRNLLRGIGGRPEELNNSNILRIWRKIKGVPPVQPEPQAPEYGPAEPVKRTAIREDNASEAAEQAILKRIMVAHTDLLKQFGPEKVMQAAEEVAYNVGDVGEIGSSDVSGWVRQVQQILGATA